MTEEERNKKLQESISFIIDSREFRDAARRATREFAANDENLKAAVAYYRSRNRDLFRAPLHYCAGVIAFSLALVLGVTASISGAIDSGNQAVVRFVGLVVAGAALVIIVTTWVVGGIQFAKFLWETKDKGATPYRWSVALLSLVVAVAGIPVALFVVDFGLSLSGVGGLVPAVKSAWLGVFT
ncbi:hypothetical protein [Bauldia sp.]|uniref:hypothetical protein n=1 Tax=Bauldia sp. TaxID=2575872 RepID=UPI003BA8C255